MKKWYQSRTLWVNFIAAVAFFVQSQFGFVIPAEYQGYALMALNALLRAVTKESLSA